MNVARAAPVTVWRTSVAGWIGVARVVFLLGFELQLVSSELGEIVRAVSGTLEPYVPS